MHNGLKIFGGSLLAVWMALNPGHALAQDQPQINKDAPTSAPTLNAPAPQQREAWMDASDFAVITPAIGIAVYGRTSDMTNQQIGEGIQRFLKNNNINSKIFSAAENRIGVKVGLFLKDLSYGPNDLPGTINNLKTVVNHFPQAWPNYQTPRENSTQQLGHE